MKVILESTTMVVNMNGIPTRIWEGKTESGIKVHAFITRIAAPAAEDQEKFKEELERCRPPSPEIENEYSLRMFL